MKKVCNRQGTWYWTGLAPKCAALESEVELNVSRRLLWLILNDESQEMIHVFGRKSSGSFCGMCQVKISSKLFSYLSNFIFSFNSGLWVWYQFYSIETQNRACFVRVCMCVCVTERASEWEGREGESAQMMFLECSNNMLNSNKTTFARFGEIPLSQFAASESVSSGIWKMSCVGSFQAVIPDLICILWISVK